MYTSTIVLSNIEAVKKFVTLANNYHFPINLATDKYKIDAKSIMGIFSLDLSKPIRIEVDDSEAKDENPEDFIQQLAQFQPAFIAKKA
jgi:phosphocarrier protein HPr